MNSYTNNRRLVMLLAVMFAIPFLHGCKPAEKPAKSVQALVKELGSTNRDTSIKAAFSLAKLKTEAVGPLIQALKGQDKQLAVRAGEVLMNIGPPAAGALRQALVDKKCKWPCIPAAALVQIGPPQQEALDILIETLKQGDPESRGFAADILGRVRSESPKIMNALLAALRDKDQRVCKTAALSLASAGSKAVKPMISALVDPEVKYPKHVAVVLGKSGADARDAAPGLVKMLKNGDDDERGAAVYVLRRIDPDPKIAVEPLVEAFNDSREQISDTAARALGEIGAPAVEALTRALGDKNNRRPGYAALGLAIAGPAASGSADELIKLLKTGDEKARGLAAFALGNVSNSETTVAALIEALKNDQSEHSVQLYAAEALGRIGTPARTAIGALTEATKHPNESVRQAATRSIKYIESPPPKHSPFHDHSKCGKDHIH